MKLIRIMHMKNIKLFLTDCDGCLTDGGMYYTEKGGEFKKFNTTDGMGFQLLRERGILTGIITGENTKIVANRAKKLKADILIQGENDKLAAIQRICSERDIRLSEVAYVGDDINDLEAVRSVGYGCTVKNAVGSVKSVAGYISEREGGNGAVREIIDWVLENDD